MGSLAKLFTGQIQNTKMSISPIFETDYITCAVCNQSYNDAYDPGRKCNICQLNVCTHCLSVDINEDVCDICYDMINSEVEEEEQTEA